MQKHHFIFILVHLLYFGGYSQTFNGRLIEMTNSRNEIRIPHIDYGVIYIETDNAKIQWKENGSQIPYKSKVRSDGQYEIDVSNLDGENFTLYFSCDSYAHIVLKNIPRSSLQEYFKILPAVRNIWKPTCGPDCLTVDKKKTYKRKSISVINGKNKLIFRRKIIEPNRDSESGLIIPIPFMDTYPADKIYFYEYVYE
ncbi:hypothetical protein [Muriicola jejuensis]|uniref:Uncharacterized protein n=1 Tax=Muriicola jejuensis TaxID=504488 RepID=A0A6P0UEU3_9FLAO|nr:hypothetical protein [Muriicola jejuensis]NER11784.1 hypothetical protein [Muriicola jejuensis]